MTTGQTHACESDSGRLKARDLDPWLPLEGVAHHAGDVDPLVDLHLVELLQLVVFLGHEQQAMKEKIKENAEKIKVNKTLPYLVSNVIEILDVDPEVN